MPIPSVITDLSPTANSNSPSGSDPPTEGDNYIRALSAIIRTEHDNLATAGTAGVGAGMIGFNTAATYATATVGYWLNLGGAYLSNTSDASKGDALIGVKRTNLANAVASTLHLQRNGHVVSLYEYLSAAQIADVEAGALTLDIGPAINTCLSDMNAKGGTLVIPFGAYSISTQIDLDRSGGLSNLNVMAYGAEFFTTGAISAFKIQNHATPHITTIQGLKINHRGNSDATAGLELVGTNNVRAIDITVEAHGVDAGYAAFLLRNLTASDSDTGCFWTLIERCTVRKRSGSDVGDIPIGVKLQGAANATIIRSCNIGGTVTDAVYIAPESGQTYIANGVLIEGTAFEGGTRAVRAVGAAGSELTGLRVMGCRIEAYTTFVSLEGSTTQPATPTYLAGNYCDAATTYLSNANSLYYTSLDSAINPAIGITLDTGSSVQVRNRAGTGIGLDVWAPTTTGPAVSVRNSAGSEILRIRQGSTTDSVRIQAQGGSGSELLELVGVDGISQAVTPARNIRGTVTLSGGTAAVSFTTNEADTNYYISLSGGATESFGWASKATTGFTINSSNSGSTAVVDWHIFR